MTQKCPEEAVEADYREQTNTFQLRHPYKQTYEYVHKVSVLTFDLLLGICTYSNLIKLRDGVEAYMLWVTLVMWSVCSDLQRYQACFSSLQSEVNPLFYHHVLRPLHCSYLIWDVSAGRVHLYVPECDSLGCIVIFGNELTPAYFRGPARYIYQYE